MPDLPQRKALRLPSFDYSAAGVYFVTICTRDKKCLFWQTIPSTPVGAAISRPPNAVELPAALTAQGEIADRAIQNIPRFYSAVSVDRYVIMPNHVHILLRFEPRAADSRPYDLSTVIGQMKRWASTQCGVALWQRSYHDHVVRGDAGYREIRQYIENNPYRWAEDCYAP